MFRYMTLYLGMALSTCSSPVIKGLVLRLARTLGEKLLKQLAVAIRRRLEFIHSPRRKSNASILVIAYMEFQDCAFWKNQAFLSLSNQVFL